MALRDLGRAAIGLKPDGTSLLGTIGQISTNIGTVSKITNLLPARATDFLNNGVSSVLADPLKVMPNGKKNLPSLVANPLEQFASYTTLWTMACLTPQQFNNPKSYRNNTAELKNVVFASAGRFDAQRTKTYFGTPEYFINNFQMNCIVGTNEKTGNTNAIKFSFDIIEPYSMGLLLQSLQNAAVNAGYVNYLQKAVYVLRMDIQGYNEVGQVIKSIKPKFFTLKLISVKFSVNEGGSLYKVEAIPYNHTGFSDTINTVFNDIKIFGDEKGKGTVEELLNTGKESLVAVLNRQEEKLVAEKKIGEPNQYSIQFPKLSSEWYSAAGDPPKNNRATLDPNASIINPITKGLQISPEVTANLPVNEIGGASLGFDQLSGGNPLFKRAGDQIDPKTGIVKRDGTTINPKLRAFHFSQKQTITSIINQVVLSSDYAKKAIQKSQDGYIKWFKLDVQIELLKPDPITGDYSKKITFRVVPYFIHESIFKNPNSAPVGYNTLMTKVVKEYNYIYTGQNVDVLRFDINVNGLFYSGINPSPENKSAKTGNQDQKQLGEQLNATTETGQGVAPAAQASPAGSASVERDPKLITGYKGGSGTKSTEQNVAENFQRAFLSGNSADLVTVDLEILGDPYWVVDSGMGNYFAPAPSETSQITADGTMNYEAGNIYVYLTFRTPADINEVTGLYDFSVAGKESPFGGIYRVNLVENTFADGIWKQKLKLLRMPGPQGPELESRISGGLALPVSKENNSATEIEKTEAPKTSPIESATKRISSAVATTVTSTSQTASGAPATPVPPPAPTAPSTPRYILQRESIKLQEAYIARLDVYKANKTEANWAAYQEARAASERFDAANNL